MPSTFTDNIARGRFELTEDGHTSFAAYRRAGDVVTIPHVETPVEARGTGAAGRLMTEVVRHARAQNLKIAPVCSYAVAWFRRHPDSHDVLE
ncbi:MAG: N-acetyltransferase [Rhodospirillaceae bacterium]|nr:N-acetyltransferase [Rhodospirillaceae bacterium]